MNDETVARLWALERQYDETVDECGRPTDAALRAPEEGDGERSGRPVAIDAA